MAKEIPERLKLALHYLATYVFTGHLDRSVCRDPQCAGDHYTCVASCIAEYYPTPEFVHRFESPTEAGRWVLGKLRTHAFLRVPLSDPLALAYRELILEALNDSEEEAA